MSNTGIKTLTVQHKEQSDLKLEIRVIPVRDGLFVTSSVGGTSKWKRNTKKEPTETEEKETYKLIDKLVVIQGQELTINQLIDDIKEFDKDSEFELKLEGVKIEFEEDEKPEEPKAESISISNKVSTMKMEDTLEVKATILPENYSGDFDVTSSSEHVTVQGKTITAVSVGESTITVTEKVSKLTDTMTVTVSEKE